MTKNDNVDAFDKPQVFTMIRKKDETGVSGTGRVLDGIIFPNGKTVICWRTETSSIAVYDSYEDFKAIHVDSHKAGSAKIEFFMKRPKKPKKKQHDIGELPDWAQNYIGRLHGLMGREIVHCKTCGLAKAEGYVCSQECEDNEPSNPKDYAEPQVIDDNIQNYG